MYYTETITYSTLRQLHTVHPVAKSDACSTGDQEGACLIPASSGNSLFMEIYHEIFSKVILFPSTDSRRVVVSFWRKNVHKYWLTT